MTATIWYPVIPGKLEMEHKTGSMLYVPKDGETGSRDLAHISS